MYKVKFILLPGNRLPKNTSSEFIDELKNASNNRDSIALLIGFHGEIVGFTKYNIKDDGHEWTYEGKSYQDKCGKGRKGIKYNNTEYLVTTITVFKLDIKAKQKEALVFKAPRGLNCQAYQGFQVSTIQSYHYYLDEHLSNLTIGGFYIDASVLEDRYLRAVVNCPLADISLLKDEKDVADFSGSEHMLEPGGLQGVFRDMVDFKLKNPEFTGFDKISLIAYARFWFERGAIVKFKNENGELVDFTKSSVVPDLE